MKRLVRTVLVVGASALALLAAYVPSAAAQRGALVVPTFCSLQTPFGTAEGQGVVIVLPSGTQVINCVARLLDPTQAPATAVTVVVGLCRTVVTPAGTAVGHCRPR